MSQKVKFRRGTIEQFEKLEQKDANTFYAVKNGQDMQLYLGQALLSQADSNLTNDDIDQAIADSIKYL